MGFWGPPPGSWTQARGILWMRASMAPRRGRYVGRSALPSSLRLLGTLATVVPTWWLASAADADPCQCLKWSEVYASGKAVCGEFAEMRIQVRPRVNLTLQEIYGLSQYPGAMGYYKEKCEQWLAHMDEPYCISVDGHAYSGWLHDSTPFDAAAWCYVSRECKNLNGGQPISDKTWFDGKAVKRHVSAKLCKSGEDRLLREASVEELRVLVRRLRAAHPDRTHMVSLGYVSLEAYKALSSEFSWAAIRPLWKSQDIGRFPGPLADAVQRKEPMIVYTDPAAHDHYKLVVGHDIYSLIEEEETRFFGLWKTGKLTCPDTVHCLRKIERDEL
uniref:Uncharacterized protein n=1 Tax=Alexandrium monilatum TaxID=311494 RepID=A0A7S4QW35_9DINO